MPTKAWLQAASKRAEIAPQDGSPFCMKGILYFTPAFYAISYPLCKPRLFLAVTQLHTESNV